MQKDGSALAALALSLAAAVSLTFACAGNARPEAPPTGAAAQTPAAQPAPVAAATSADAKPSVKVVGEEAFDFGGIWPGEHLEHAFVLSNSGGAPLHILRLQPG